MIVHLNGSLIPASEAKVSVFDRGFLFGDGLYEGLRAVGGHIVGVQAHINRLIEGLRESRLEGFDPHCIPDLSRRLLEANQLEDAFIYWQITRGAPRPGDPVRRRIPGDMSPTVFGYAEALPAVRLDELPKVRRMAVRPDLRWLRGHIKAISLMGGILAAIEADELGCEDAVMIRDGRLAESVSANVVIAPAGWVAAKGRMKLATPSLDSAPILAGVTRGLLLREAPHLIEERPVSEAELRSAEEIMLVGTITMVVAVSHLGASPVGETGRTGRPGPASVALWQALVAAIERERSGACIHS